MTSTEARRIGQLNAELAVAMKALNAIATEIDLQASREIAGAALKVIRSKDPKDWEQAYLLDDLLKSESLTNDQTGLLI
jgi:hypothetical protein